MKHGFKIAILFNIPKALHMLTACKLNSPGQNSPFESKPMFTTTHCTAVPGCGRDAANSSSLLLFFPCPHPDWWCYCPFTNTGQNLGLILLSLSLEIDSLGWPFASNCQATSMWLLQMFPLLHCLSLSSAKTTPALLTILHDLTLPTFPVIF